MLLRLLGLVTAQPAAATPAAPAEGGRGDRADRLRGFVATLPPSVQADLGAALGQDALPEPFRRAILETIRPTLVDYRPTRPRTLWRAVCMAAEPCLVADQAAAAQGDWAVPRSLLGALREDVSRDVADWPRLEAAYAAARTPTARLRTVRGAMTAVGEYLLAVHAGFGARGRAVRTFGRLLLAGPRFLEAAHRTLKVSDADLDLLAFVPPHQRPSFPFSTENAQAFEEAVGASAGTGLDSLAIIQASLLVRPAPLVLRTAPRSARQRPQMLMETTAAAVLDWLFWRLEGQADAVRAGVADLEPLLAGERAAEAAAVAELIVAFDAEIHALTSTIQIDRASPLGARLGATRRRVGEVLVSKALPAALARLTAVIESTAWREPTGHAAATVAALVLVAAGGVADRCGQGLASGPMLAAARTALGKLAASLSPQDQDAAGRLICLAAALEDAAVARGLRDRCNANWDAPPLAASCPRAGRWACCAAGRLALAADQS